MKPCTVLPAVIGLGLTATLLVGCSGGPAGPTEPVSVDFWYSVTGKPADTLVALVDEFNSSHDGVTVNAIFQGRYEESIAKLANAVQGGGLPTIIQGGDTFSTYLRDSGLTVPPKQVKGLDGKAFDAADLVPANANYYTFNGELSSIPIMVSQPVVFVDKRRLEAAGVDPSSAPATLAELFDTADAVSAASGSAGLTAHVTAWWAEQFAASAGVTYCTPGNGVGAEAATGFAYTTEAQLASWRRVQALVASGAMLNPGPDGSASTNAFISGEAAMVLQSSSAYGEVAASGIDFGVLPLPTDSGKGDAVPGGNSVWLVQEGSDDRQLAAAASFGAFLASPDAQERIFDETGYLPSSVEALNRLTGAVAPAQEVILQQLDETSKSVAGAGCHSGAMGEARPFVISAIEEILGGGDVSAALTKAQEAGDTAIRDYNARK